MAAVIAVAENVFSIHRWWIAPIVGVAVFVIVDRIVISHVVEPMIEARQRRILDRAADDLGELGLGGPVDLVIPHFTGVCVDVVVLGRIRLSAPIGKKTTDSRPAQTSAAAVTDVISSIATPIWVAATMKGSDVA
jgi:hypothetical protein